MEERKSINYKYIKFNEIRKHYEFNIDINTEIEFVDNIKKNVSVRHKKCGNEFNVVLSRIFLNESNANLNKIRKYLDDRDDEWCPFCMQEAKNKYFKEILEDVGEGDFTLIGNYTTSKEYVKIKHKSCKNTFKVLAGAISIKKRISCKVCKSKTSSKEARLQKERNIEFQEKLDDLGLSDFKNIGNYINLTTNTRFRHELCGHEFEDNPSSFLRRKDKCPVCTGNNRIIYKNQKERNNEFQKNLNRIIEGFKLRGDYLGRTKEVTLYHEKCKKEFTEVYDGFIKARYKCPFCESNRYKYNRNLTIKQKIKYFEDKFNRDYKILDGFVCNNDEVNIKHLMCGTVFKKRISNLIRKKDGTILCPHCERNRRRDNFLKKLNDKFEGCYILVGEFTLGTEEVTFKHKGCNKSFRATPNQMLSKTVEDCPYCAEENLNRANIFRNKLYNKYKSSYVMIGKYSRHNEKVLFKHRECGSMFWETPSNMLRKRIPCKKCATLKRVIPKSEVISRISEKNGTQYKLVGEYEGTNKDTSVMCNNCYHIFEIKPSKLFRRKLCPNCEAKHP